MVPHPHARIAKTWLVWASRFVALLALAFAGSSAAHAQTTNDWDGAIDSRWENPQNWSLVTLPTPTSNVTINVSNAGSGGIINFSPPVIGPADAVSINMLALGSISGAVAPFLTINGSSTLTSNASFIGAVSANGNNNNFSQVLVTDASSVWTIAGDLLIGYNGGIGTLNVNALGLVAASGNIITSSTASGGNVAGVGSIVLDGGIVQANGTIIISNAGNAITSTFSPTNGYANYTNGLQGQGVLNGNVSVDGNLLPNGITIPSGLLAFGNNLTLTANANLTFPLTGHTRVTEYSAINVGGNTVLNGTLTITLPFGYLPLFGDSYGLFQFGGNATGNFTTYNVPFIDGFLGWDVSNLSVNGSVAVVNVFSTQPVSIEVAVTTNASFSVGAANLTTPSYQWQVLTGPNANWKNIADGALYIGTNTSNLTVLAVNATESGYQFRATTTNLSGIGVSSSATLKVDTTMVWTGTTSTDWFTTTNWNFGIVPLANLSAQINTGSGNQPVIATNATAANITVGFNGTSTSNTSLTVNSGGNLTAVNFYMGFGPTAVGSLSITGPGANVTLAGSMAVGFNGTGNLSLANGAILTNTFGYVGAEPGSTGTATLVGSGTTWAATNDMNVGYYGNGTLTVGAGALVSSPNRFTIAAIGTSIGVVNLNGGTIKVLSGNGSIAVNRRGSLTGNGTVIGSTFVSGNLTPTGTMVFTKTLGFTPSANIHFVLGGNTPGSYGAALATSNVTLAGNVVISLGNGFVPAFGQVFTLLSASGNFVNTFATVTPPSIPGGLGLDLSNFTNNDHGTQGTVKVVRVILSQSSSPLTLTETASGNFSVTAVNPGATFKWQRSRNGGLTWSDMANDQHFTGVKSPTLNITDATVDMSGSLFRCVVTDFIATAIGDPLTLIVNPQFLVTTEPPATASVLSGNTVNLLFSVTSPQALTFQWYKNGRPVSVGPTSNLQVSSNATTTVLTITGITKTNNGGYSVVATSDLNGKKSSTITQVYAVTKPPHIITQPYSVTAKTGRTVVFRSYVNGDQLLNFQWLYNGVPLVNGPGISGATASGINSSALILTGVTSLQDGTYQLTVTNAKGTVSGKVVTLTVN
jgi:T5SS/PEP-CTERM-associated repeat protein